MVARRRRFRQCPGSLRQAGNTAGAALFNVLQQQEQNITLRTNCAFRWGVRGPGRGGLHVQRVTGALSLHAPVHAGTCACTYPWERGSSIWLTLIH